MSEDSQHRVDIISVPTEAGTHIPGQCKAPDWIIEQGGLARKLRDNAGCHVAIHGECENGIFGTKIEDANSWKPSEKVEGARNLPNTVKVMHWVHDYLRSQNDMGSTFPIILGGDCSITPAIFSAFSHWHPNKKVGLLYVDGDADLTLPSQTSAEGSSGILDSMVISHLTRREGGLEQMKDFSHPDGSALVNPENVVLFGFDPLQPATEHWVYLLENGFKCFTRPSVQKDPIGCARKALAYLEDRVNIILLHFDVDVIDCGLFPLANYPHYAGLRFKNATGSVGHFLQHEKVQGLVVTEVNPNNDSVAHRNVQKGDERVTMVERLVDELVLSFKKRLSDQQKQS